jgi:hypothetical protein
MSFSDRDVKSGLALTMDSIRRLNKSGDGSFCGHMVQNDLKQNQTEIKRSSIWGNIGKLVERGAITKLFMPSDCKDLDNKHSFYRLMKPGQDAYKMEGTKAFAAAMAAREKENAIAVPEHMEENAKPELTYTAKPSPISIEIPKDEKKTIQITININVGK